MAKYSSTHECGVIQVPGQAWQSNVAQNGAVLTIFVAKKCNVAL